MKSLVRFLVVAFLVVFGVRAAGQAVTALHGTITKLDAASKTVVVKTKDGAEQTVHFTEKTAVWGADKTAAGAKDAFKGLSEGSEVVVHYTGEGAESSATEIDKVGKGGLKSVDGTVEKVGADGKTVVVKAADGTEHTFAVAGKGAAAGATKAERTTVYYAEEGGKKVAHFFEKL